MNKTSLIIVGICAVAFVIQLTMPAFEEIFLLQSSEVFSRPWILITSMFLHGNFNHLFYNMFALGLFGFILENIIGTKKFLSVYLVGGLISGIAATLFYSAALGASGGIMAILGTLAILRPKMKVWIGYVPMPMAVAAIVWIAGDFIGLFAPNGIANAAHLGGMVLGLIAGVYLKKQYGDKSERKLIPISERRFSSWEDKWMS